VKHSTLLLTCVALALPTAAHADEAAAPARPRRTLAIELGGGVVDGLVTSDEYDRTNSGIFGALVFGQDRPGSPLVLAAELALGSELSGEDERGGYGYILGGLRIGYRPGGSRRAPTGWAAARFGSGGHTTSQFASGLGVGVHLPLAGPIDLAATLDVVALAPAHDHLFDEEVDAAIVATAGLRLGVRFGV
jgi:hypothetical protein